MKKVVRGLIIGILIGASTRFIGVAKAISPAEDNCPENREYMYCLDRTTPLWTYIYMMYIKKKNLFIYDNQIQIKLLNWQN